MNNRVIKLLIIIVLLMCCATVARGQMQFKRDLQKVCFIPKGQWVTGVSVNYTESSQNNYQFLIIEGISGDNYSFKVSPMICYMFQDDLGAGGRFAYQRSLTKLSNASVVIDSETDYNVENFYSLSHNYYGTAILRNYISLGTSKRFGLYNEVQLQVGGGQSKLCNGKGEDFTGTYETNFSLDVGLAPGIVMFLNNYSAIEVNVGVLGFSYNTTKSTTDRIYVAKRDSKSANFKINLFSISFGVAFYL